ncbi:MAG TPA: hypothetical protein VGO55_10715 [Allosphingosinicella sp.]|jgi:hypothetical protein|nr:hypothetical protein [Allosphingosinicella sp.]
MRRGPLRFLVLAVGLWICARAAILAPGWWPERDALAPPASASTATPSPAPGAAPAPAALPFAGEMARNRGTDIAVIGTPPTPLVIESVGLGPSPALAAAEPPTLWRGWDDRPAAALAGRPPRRWSVSGWMLVRHDPGGPALAPAGTLGGSQAGARVSYRLGDGFALSVRAYLPLRRTAGAEAAAGVEWRPVAAIPVNILAERRQALGREGRSAFALTLHGGGSFALPHRLRLDAYAQAGVVGLRSRDLFADGAVRLSAPVGPVEIGVGARGAAQPGAARLDAGPGLAYRLPLRGASVRIEADWRFRVAGAAAPGSGPALTLATDF